MDTNSKVIDTKVFSLLGEVTTSSMIDTITIDSSILSD
jgi:hypothetical protein